MSLDDESATTSDSSSISAGGVQGFWHFYKPSTTTARSATILEIGFWTAPHEPTQTATSLPTDPDRQEESLNDLHDVSGVLPMHCSHNDPSTATMMASTSMPSIPSLDTLEDALTPVPTWLAAEGTKPEVRGQQSSWSTTLPHFFLFVSIALLMGWVFGNFWATAEIKWGNDAEAWDLVRAYLLEHVIWPKKPDLDEKAKKHLELWLQFANGRVASIRIYGHMLLVSQDVEHKTWKLVVVGFRPQQALRRLLAKAIVAENVASDVHLPSPSPGPPPPSPSADQGVLDPESPAAPFQENESPIPHESSPSSEVEEDTKVVGGSGTPDADEEQGGLLGVEGEGTSESVEEDHGAEGSEEG